MGNNLADRDENVFKIVELISICYFTSQIVTDLHLHFSVISKFNFTHNSRCQYSIYN